MKITKYKQILFELNKQNNIKQINDDTIELLQSILFRQNNYDVLINEDGFYRIENNKYVRIETTSDKHYKIENYIQKNNKQNNDIARHVINNKLYINQLIETKEQIFHIPYSHINLYVERYEYKLNECSQLIFCIEKTKIQNDNNNVIYHYYFILPFHKDENQTDIKQEICLFLSKLTS